MVIVCTTGRLQNSCTRHVKEVPETEERRLRRLVDAFESRRNRARARADRHSKAHIDHASHADEMRLQNMLVLFAAGRPRSAFDHQRVRRCARLAFDDNLATKPKHVQMCGRFAPCSTRPTGEAGDARATWNFGSSQCDAITCAQALEQVLLTSVTLVYITGRAGGL